MPASIEQVRQATALTRAGLLAQAARVIQRALALVPRTHQPSPAPAARAAGAASFVQHHWISGGQIYSYHLYTPQIVAHQAVGPMPVLLMLHGCNQDAVDFALGTQMNALAQQHQCLVVYPEQLASVNRLRCWSWFEPAHQLRGQGEPEMIASLARDVVTRFNGDAQRVYVAGLSAGGAMASLLALLYPDVFAAAGVHSGLPPASADGVISAFAAMRKGRVRAANGASAGAVRTVPTIVFHGDADKTVHPVNGKRIVAESLAALDAAGIAVQPMEELREQGGRSATRTAWTDADGLPLLEHWQVASGPHAWSGGDAQGSYTDPQGPGASEAMLAFFLRHRRPD